LRVAVIGAGLLGVCAAWFLRRHGFEVTVVERQPGPALETSFANGGMLTPSQANPWNEPGFAWRVLGALGREHSPFQLRARALPALLGWGLRFARNSASARYRDNTVRNARLAGYSLAQLRALRAQLDLDYDASTVGTMKVFRDRRALDNAVRWSAVMAECGVVHRLLDAAAAVALEPALEPIAAAIAGAIVYPEDESGDARAFCAALAERAGAAGVQFLFDTPVTALVREGRRIRALATTAGTLKADTVVLAAGSYSPSLTRPLGVTLPVQPVKGYSLTIPAGGWNGAPRVPIVDESLHVAATPLGDRLRVAGKAEFSGLERDIDPRQIAALAAAVRALFPTLPAHLDLLRAQPWCGLRPMSCDGVPILGRTPFANLYLNTGHGHLGWSMAPGSGRLVADIVAGTEPALDPGPYALARFRVRA